MHDLYIILGILISRHQVDKKCTNIPLFSWELYYMPLFFFENCIIYLYNLRGAKASQPKEATLSRGYPHARQEVEDIGPGHGAFQVQKLLVLRHATIHEALQLLVRQVLAQRGPQLEHQLAVLFNPPSILHVKYCSCSSYHACYIKRTN